MIYLQVLANGLVLGGLYAAIAVGFSLVWGVLNVINLLHGSFIILGAYVAFFAYALFGLHPFLSAPIAGVILFAIGYSLQGAIINRVIRAPVLMTLTLTFGLDLLLNNAMLLALQGRLPKSGARSAARLDFSWPDRAAARPGRRDDRLRC